MNMMDMDMVDMDMVDMDMVDMDMVDMDMVDVDNDNADNDNEKKDNETKTMKTMMAMTKCQQVSQHTLRLATSPIPGYCGQLDMDIVVPGNRFIAMVHYWVRHAKQRWKK